MKGATPVPGPTITKGTDRSAGGRKVQLGLEFMWTCGSEAISEYLQKNNNNESNYNNVQKPP